MFTRQEVCALADIQVERFKSLVRRDQLPTINVPSSGASDSTRDAVREPGWNRFSAFDTFMIAVQESFSREIGYADGLSSKTASMIVSNNRDVIHDVLLAPSRTRDQWLGYAGGSPNKPGSNELPGGRNVSGTLKDILRAMEHDEAGHARLFLVNVNAVLRDVDARAKKHLKIDFGASARIELADDENIDVG